MEARPLLSVSHGPPRDPTHRYRWQVGVHQVVRPRFPFLLEVLRYQDEQFVDTQW